MPRTIRMRLYRVQDFDLYTLYYDENIPFQQICYNVTKAYANGRPLPEINVKNVAPLKFGYPSSIMTSFAIPDGDEETYKMLQKLSDRNRNNFIKFLVRRALVDIEGIFFKKEDADSYHEERRKEKPKPVVSIKEPETKVPAPVIQETHNKEETVAPEPVRTAEPDPVGADDEFDDMLDSLVRSLEG